MKGFKIYIGASIALLLIVLAVFFKHIQIGYASICPVFLIFLSALQSVIFMGSSKSADRGEPDTAFSANNSLTISEYSLLSRIHGLSKIAIIPIFVAFVFFFPPIIKIILPIVLYVMSFIIAKAVFNMVKKST